MIQNAFKIITFGCRVNQAESRMLGEELVRSIRGIKSTKSIKGADLVILNTCCVTVKAEKEVRQAIRRIKKDNPKCFLVVCGCWVDKIRAEVDKNSGSLMTNLTRFANRARESSYLPFGQSRDTVNTQTLSNLSSTLPMYSQSLRTFSLIDLLVSNKDKSRIMEKIQKLFPNYSLLRQLADTNYSNYHDKYANDRKTIIKIQDGCNNFCSYCIVPQVRGRSVSRSVEGIINEIKQKEKERIKEVILTGIDLEDYKFNIKNQISNIKSTYKKLKIALIKNDLVRLIRLILTETDIKKISFGSMGWKIIDKEFLELFNNFLINPSGYLTTNLTWSKGQNSVSYENLSVSEPTPKKLSEDNMGKGGVQASTNMKNFIAFPRFELNTHRNCISPRSCNLQPTTYNRLSSHFHIPIQSGCNETLKRMKRNYSIENCKLKIENLNKNVPGFSFSTDLIVGFPGETEKEFEKTLLEIKEIKKLLGKKFTKIHIFRYSSRPGTLAAKMEGKKGWEKVAEREKQKRANLLQAIFN